MKGKEITFAELEEKINIELAALDGRKYESLLHIQTLCAEAIEQIFSDLGIKELRFPTWEVYAETTDEIVNLWDPIGKVWLDKNDDKRYKYSQRPGKLNNVRLKFDDELMNLSLSDGRRFLLNQRRDKGIANLNAQINELLEELEKLQNLLEPLYEAQF